MSAESMWALVILLFASKVHAARHIRKSAKRSILLESPAQYAGTWGNGWNVSNANHTNGVDFGVRPNKGVIAMSLNCG